MIFYVSHKNDSDSDLEQAKRITHDLQANDLVNCYICPLLVLSHLKCGEVSHEQEFALRCDILQMCDKMIVASEETDLVKAEISLASSLQNVSHEPIEVVRLEERYSTV